MIKVEEGGRSWQPTFHNASLPGSLKTRLHTARHIMKSHKANLSSGNSTGAKFTGGSTKPPVRELNTLIIVKELELQVISLEGSENHEQC